MRCDSITEVIGDTPLVRISPEIHGLKNIDLYAKLEMLNPFGSVKDRAAWSMVRESLGDARAEGQTVIELSSGNTAKALAVISGMHGVPFKSVTNRMKVPEIKDLLLLIGADIEELPGQAECLDPTNVDDPLTRIHQAIAQDSTYLHTDQYFNQRNTAAHIDSTGPEIIADLDGQAPDYFIACVGTAGSSTGVAKVLREARDDVNVIGLVAHKSDFIPGIRNIDEVHEVGLFDPDTYDTIESVSADEAIDGMLDLVRRCGMLAGPTGGAAYYGAQRYLQKVDGQLEAEGLGQRRSAVFIVCDRVESYMSYVRARRPELLGQTARPHSVTTVRADELSGVTALDPGDAQEWIDAANPIVVDLRGAFAYSASHIAGAINIVDELFGELLRGGLPFGKSQPALLTCPVGEKSAKYAALLKRMGHENVRSLEGGIVAWRDAGAPLVRD
ncbi:pyridoxal-phosphate dependent enzyme [Hoyosella subflava]|uniref:Pyridoxal-phosphate dependent enzyme n=1 Tax=Hoyosella subflava (strain DSM 45089 / JCM 17490 / NBRC 109087 / DQS3-9A1) TaxID=443218 RepID=F6EQV0_HOYSD|nr:pyridoxal-phosphate dependent enzyme [Hoyosella subflava]AEF39561.1 Pyridoxal-phosphate dependent enzyme [Hoyosella subflava DQS3-9A1]